MNYLVLTLCPDEYDIAWMKVDAKDESDACALTRLYIKETDPYNETQMLGALCADDLQHLLDDVQENENYDVPPDYIPGA